MPIVIITIIVLLIGLAIVAGGVLVAAARRPPEASAIAVGIAIGVAGLAVMAASLGFTEVGAGQVGIITNFGRIEEGTLGPGLNWRLPVVTSVTIMDTRVQTYQFTNIGSFTLENQPAALTGVVNYHIEPDGASDLYQSVGVNYAARILEPQAETELKQDARRFRVDEITSKRSDLARIAQEALAADVARYHVVIDGIYIADISLSEDYLQSVEQKQIAQQNVEKAKADADARRAQAQGEADAQVTLANGQAEANDLVNASLTQQLIQWQTVQKLAPNVSVMLIPSDQGFLFNIPLPSATP